MDKIERCNPSAHILKHMNLPLDKIKKFPERYIGMVMPNGKKIESRCDIIDFLHFWGDDHITFGERHCGHKDERTGFCLGHAPEFAPKDFKVTAIVTKSNDFYNDICYNNFRYYPVMRELLNAKVGDYITLKRADFDEAIKLVITCTISIYDDSSHLGVWPVMQRTKLNGKVQYYI